MTLLHVPCCMCLTNLHPKACALGGAGVWGLLLHWQGIAGATEAVVTVI